MARTPLYRIRRCSYITLSNALHVWFEVDRGDSSRDYAAADYAPLACVGKFRTEADAKAFVTSCGGELV